MSKRGRNLAGLAALGALGYFLSRKQDGSNVPVEDRGTMAKFAAPEQADLAKDYPDYGRAMTSEEPVARASSVPGPRMETPEQTVARVGADAMSKGRRAAPESKYVPSTAPGTMGAYKTRAGIRASEPSASTVRDTRPDLSTPEGRKKAEQAQALERVTPEEYLVGGPGLKGLNALAKSMANRSKPLKEYVQGQLPGPKDAVRQLPAPSPRLPGPKGAAEEVVDVREKVTNPMFWMGGPRNADNFKKGGKIKKMASGGTVSSASRRGDGIAQRGKTKGRIC